VVIFGIIILKTAPRVEHIQEILPNVLILWINGRFAVLSVPVLMIYVAEWPLYIAQWHIHPCTRSWGHVP